MHSTLYTSRLPITNVGLNTKDRASVWTSRILCPTYHHQPLQTRPGLLDEWRVPKAQCGKLQFYLIEAADCCSALLVAALLRRSGVLSHTPTVSVDAYIK